MENRFHYTRHAQGGFVVLDRVRPIQTATRVDTEGEAKAKIKHLEALHKKRDEDVKGLPPRPA